MKGLDTASAFRAPRRSERSTEGGGLSDRILSIEALLTAALLGAFALLRLRQPIGDPDFGWHLAAGRYILDHLTLPRVDGFSYVAHGRPWVAYSWLPEVFFAALDDVVGPAGAIALAALLVTATFAIVLATCRLAGARHVVAVGATLLAGLTSAPTWTVRPHLFSFLFTAVVCHLVMLDRTRPADRGQASPVPRCFWILVPVAVVWANSHVFFVYGFGLLGLHILTHWRSWLWDQNRSRVRWQTVLFLLAAAAGLLVNPHGIGLLTHVAGLPGEETTFAMVSELQTPSLHETHGQLLTTFSFALALALIFSRTPKDPGEVAAVFLFALLAYSMARNMPFFAIVGAPILARHTEGALPGTGDARPPMSPLRRRIHGLMLASLCTLFVAGVARSAVYPGNATLSRTRFPVDAVAYLNAQPVLGRLFNHFNWGGYLIATLHPRYQVSMDGRTGVYGEDTLRQYRATQFLKDDWRGFLRRCDPDLVLWRPEEPFVHALELLPEWRRLYEDDVAVIFTRERRPMSAHDAAGSDEGTDPRRRRPQRHKLTAHAAGLPVSPTCSGSFQQPATPQGFHTRGLARGDQPAPAA